MTLRAVFPDGLALALLEAQHVNDRRAEQEDEQQVRPEENNPVEVQFFKDDQGKVNRAVLYANESFTFNKIE